MAFRRHLATILLATALLSTALLVLPDGLSVSSMAEAGEVEGDAGALLALATDLNPGSCFSESIPLLFALPISASRSLLSRSTTT